jgi:hypothetical protein
MEVLDRVSDFWVSHAVGLLVLAFVIGREEADGDFGGDSYLSGDDRYGV